MDSVQGAPISNLKYKTNKGPSKSVVVEATKGPSFGGKIRQPTTVEASFVNAVCMSVSTNEKNKKKCEDMDKASGQRCIKISSTPAGADFSDVLMAD